MNIPANVLASAVLDGFVRRDMIAGIVVKPAFVSV
jgi:hypothetical protein